MLTACGGWRDAQALPDPLPVRYYSTQAEGRPALSWELKVWTPDRATLKATYTDAAPGGIADRLRWSVRGDGNCEQMRFSAVPSAVAIGPRDVVQLLVDGTPAFYGYVETAWPQADGRLREYVAVGAAELMRVRYTDARSWERAIYPDVADVVRDAYTRWTHPAIAGSDIRDTGRTLDVSTPGPIPVGKLFDDLAAAAETTWGVDADGVLFFARPGGSVVVGYEEQGLRWLPVEADEIVTRVIAWGGYRDTGSSVHVVAGATDEVIDTPQDRVPLYLVAYEAPEHATYGAEKAFAFATERAEYGADASVTQMAAEEYGLDLQVTGVAVCSTSGTVASTYDGDTATGFRVYLGDTGLIGTGWFDATIAPVWGDGFWATAMKITWRSSHALDSANGITAYVRGTAEAAPGLYYYRDVPLSGSSGTIEVYGGPLASIEGIYIQIDPAKFDCGSPAWFEISELEVWGIWMSGYQEAGRSLIRLPYQQPAEVEWQGYQPPAATMTITGAPGGDLTGLVESWEYELSPRRFVTRARLGSRGLDETTRAIRIVADRRREAAEGTALVLARRR